MRPLKCLAASQIILSLFSFWPMIDAETVQNPGVNHWTVPSPHVGPRDAPQLHRADRGHRDHSIPGTRSLVRSLFTPRFWTVSSTRVERSASRFGSLAAPTKRQELIPAALDIGSSIRGQAAGILLFSRAAAPATPRAYQSALRAAGINHAPGPTRGTAHVLSRNGKLPSRHRPRISLSSAG
jgi:hypothetical protein